MSLETRSRIVRGKITEEKKESGTKKMRTKGSTDAHKEYTEYVAFVGRTMNITYKLSARGYKTQR